MNSGDPGLPEKDFFHEGVKQNPFPFWFWLFFIVLLVSIVFTFQNWYQNYRLAQIHHSPFLQVTNRDLSLFLWQFPEHMRAHAKKKNGYLVGFQYLSKVTVEPEMADSYVQAPPELLFLYHTWDRLIRDEVVQRPIPPQEFLRFLDYAEEWQPQYWPKAPEEYKILVSSLAKTPLADLQTLSDEVLPKSVRVAFLGWKNYFQEGENINQVKPTVADLEKFLKSFPHYSRNYWRNIISTDYLLFSLQKSNPADQPVANKELAPFLKAAFYNFQMAEKSTTTAQL